METDKRVLRARRIKRLFFSIALSLVVSSFIMFFVRSILISTISFFSIVAIILVYVYLKEKLEISAKIKRMEDVFPDFLQLMSSNLRAGMTIDQAIFLSSRPEFQPLDQEIYAVSKEIATGKEVERVLLDMSKRINSEKINKIILLIISGINSGGNLATLLEETSVNMRQKVAVEKKAASSVLMYAIFIFLVVSIFAPILFALSTVLVDILTNILSGLPEVNAPFALPFTFSTVSISTSFIRYFSLSFIVISDILASLVLGQVLKGDEKQGLRYIPYMVALSVATFFLVRILVSNFLTGIL